MSKRWLSERRREYYHLRAKEEGYDIGRELERHNSTVVLTGTGDGLLTEQGASLGDIGVVLVLGKTGMKKNPGQRC